MMPMGEIFHDESIHESGGFIVGAFVYCDRDPTSAVNTALVQARMRPGIDEFKSSALMSSRPDLMNLRDALCSIVQESKIGLLVMPSDHRSELGNEALLCLEKILRANRLDQSRQTVYFDNGIVPCVAAQQEFKRTFGDHCELRLDQNSITVAGLQFADLTAHYLGTMLLAEMGKVSKKVRAGESSGYLPDLQIELEFELWARLRYSWFSSGRGLIGIDDCAPDDIRGSIASMSVDVANYGLYISRFCGSLLYDSAMKRFGASYMGCIH
jgi:hypothetical protein